MRTTSRRLRVLAVDDLPSALDDLCRLLRESPMIENVTAAGDPLTALKLIQNERYDAVLLDISMPGLDGLELANLLAKLGDPPAIVFVTAHDRHAVAAFGIGAADYLLKPVRAERLSATLARVLKFLPEEPDATRGAAIADVLAALPVDSGGRTVYVRRSEVHFVEAQGDYVKLHTAGGVHLYRMPISRLEEYWEAAGFLRTHRGYLVALGAIRELRTDSSGLFAHTALGDVPVSRRMARELRERLLDVARSSETGPR
ncbi:LytTR family DNA-binding domain-containing protein [Nocardia sp. CA2R105]|uniref:LytR/AlgR family response regulator transcription factor n=1 Tax=Nocardia coffeae TaxID=2873381 RepID=UPI001CA722E8|nr:LytTR family DNA-binding domain-containing protein [Nocardia coffeae]MBY8855313.1 LytTR family DNA-binding domain-containing protein [Nocardia coffeae]